jgi:O-succinylbenzoic acid--CoA ligase
MAGYLGEPPLAADAWFDTGDLGEFDPQGNLHLLARRHDLIVTGGDNVAPLEVERALEALPGIRAAAVFGVPDDTWGEIVAAVVVAAASPPSDAALRGHLDAQLARHKRPRRIAFVDELPLTAAGKLDRAALAALATRLRPLA